MPAALPVGVVKGVQGSAIDGAGPRGNPGHERLNSPPHLPPATPPMPPADTTLLTGTLEGTPAAAGGETASGHGAGSGSGAGQTAAGTVRAAQTSMARVSEAQASIGRQAPPPRPFPPELLAHPGDKDIQIDLRHLSHPPPPAPPAAPVIFAVAAGFDSILGSVVAHAPLSNPTPCPRLHAVARSMCLS